MQIQITSQHIRTGTLACQRPGTLRECHCPTALAIKDVVHPETLVDVVNDFVYFLRPGGTVREIVLPDEVGVFIGRFDAGYRMDPLRFHLDIPTEFLPEVTHVAR